MVSMVKKIIQQKGVCLLDQPKNLEEELRNAGCTECEIHTVMLILTGCPATAATLTGGSATRTEIHNLIRSITKETGLNVHVVRHVLGELMVACGLVTRESVIYSVCPVSTLNGRRLPRGGKLAAELACEDELVRKLAAELESKNEDAAVFGRLQLMAEQGNAEAAYRLGMYFKSGSDFADQERAEYYFMLGADLGYGPAHGALAACLSRDVRKIDAAMKQVSHPLSVCGREGRKWKTVMDKLMKYQRTNVLRLKGLLQGQLLSVLMMTVMLVLCGADICMVMAAGLQTGGLACTLWGRFRKQHLSCTIPMYLMITGWIMALLGIMFGGGMV